MKSVSSLRRRGVRGRRETSGSSVSEREECEDVGAPAYAAILISMLMCGSASASIKLFMKTKSQMTMKTLWICLNAGKLIRDVTELILRVFFIFINTEHTLTCGGGSETDENETWHLSGDTHTLCHLTPDFFPSCLVDSPGQRSSVSFSCGQDVWRPSSSSAKRKSFLSLICFGRRFMCCSLNLPSLMRMHLSDQTPTTDWLSEALWWGRPSEAWTLDQRRSQCCRLHSETVGRKNGAWKSSKDFCSISGPFTADVFHITEVTWPELIAAFYTFKIMWVST